MKAMNMGGDDEAEFMRDFGIAQPNKAALKKVDEKN